MIIHKEKTRYFRAPLSLARGLRRLTVDFKTDTPMSLYISTHKGVSMKSIVRLFLSISLLIFTAITCLATPLDDYVAKPDNHYSYSVHNKVKGDGYTAYNIALTSQKWRSASEVDAVLWQHWLTVITPDIVTHDTALLWITGGSRDDTAPAVDEGFAQLAVTTKSVTALIRNIPFQPIKFSDMPNSRLEDDIIAYTFDKYLNGGDAEWPLLLPMVKAAVRAMDTIASHVEAVDPGAPKIEKFVVSGASKRGWTTWLTAAADPRVVAIAPAVIDVLKLDTQMKHHRRSYGFYSSAIEPFGKMNVFDRLGSEKGIELARIVDPYSYLDRLTMPKLIINSSGDQFFLTDSSQFYFHELQGNNSLRYIPNTDHCLNGSLSNSLFAFYCCILNARQLPQIECTLSPDHATITALSDASPIAVKIWSATNPNAKDFRQEIIGNVWKSTVLKPDKNGSYIATRPIPTNGWSAFFIEFTFDAGNNREHILTTDICVAPNNFPQPPSKISVR